MRCILVCLFIILPFISCLTPDDITTKWLLDYIKTSKQNISNNDDSESNSSPSAVQTAPNLNPNDGQSKPNLTPTAGILGHTSKPVGGHRGPNLNPSEARNSCLTKDGLPGECVSYYICDEHNTLIDDGADIIDVRYNPKCPHYLLVCCGINNIATEEEGTINEETLSPEVTTPSKKDISPSERPSVFSFEENRPNVEEVSEDEVVNFENILTSHQNNVTYTRPTTCGWNNVDISPFQPKNSGVRPINITSSFYGEFPFMVAVLLNRNSNVWSPNDYIGGGALIHYRVVLTAAHKVYNQAEKLKCRAGEYDTQTIREQYPHQERNVAKVKIHDDFFIPSVYNDIALLFLETPFSEAPHIGIACLSPSIPEKTDDCYTTGWGRQINDLSSYAVILKKIPLPLVGASECQSLLRKTRLGPFFELHQSLTCAGGDSSIDACVGDGGSPLVCSIASNGLNKRFVVTGLVAYGIKCGTIGVPGVYVNVPFLYNWIETQMNNEKIIEKNYKL